jgi:hypothetical protein
MKNENKCENLINKLREENDNLFDENNNMKKLFYGVVGRIQNYENEEVQREKEIIVIIFYI